MKMSLKWDAFFNDLIYALILHFLENVFFYVVAINAKYVNLIKNSNIRDITENLSLLAV